MSFLADTIQAAGVPEVVEGPIDFEQPVTLKYRAFRCSRERATITVATSVGGMPADGAGFVVRPGKDGKVRFALGGGLLQASEVGKGSCAITVLDPLKTGGDALPTQAADGGEVRRIG
jgi:hypothetical protein